MHHLTFTLIVTLILTSTLAQDRKCRRDDNCKAPDCRCWDDPSPPGGYAAQDVPQMVLISFEYAVNSANVDLYQSIFAGVKNPNQCEPKGTFFVSKSNTDFAKVKELFDNKHEIGMTTPDGSIPQDETQWEDAFMEMKAELLQAGLPEAAIQGTRGPELYNGGDDQFEALDSAGLTYDSTCTTIEYTTKANLLWPYTYDFTEGTPECTIGRTPVKAFPGKWQFLVADFEFNGQKCASPSACSPVIKTSQDAFDMLYESFIRHYEGQRSPFHVFVDPLWLTTAEHRTATLQFLQFVTILPDTWIVTTQQALAWIQDPVPAANATDFAPWKC